MRLGEEHIECPCAGIVAQNGQHRSPARDPDALFHHGAVLLRRLPTRNAASQPPAGEQTRHRATHVTDWSHGLTCRPVGGFLFLPGPAGLLRSPHVRTAVKPGAVHPHQLDGPRWERLLFVLQRLSSQHGAALVGRYLGHKRTRYTFHGLSV